MVEVVVVVGFVVALHTTHPSALIAVVDPLAHVESQDVPRMSSFAFAVIVATTVISAGMAAASRLRHLPEVIVVVTFAGG